jgi:hypothetical protein
MSFSSQKKQHGPLISESGNGVDNVGGKDGRKNETDVQGSAEDAFGTVLF